MGDAFAVRARQRLRERRAVGQRFGKRQRPAREPGAERLAIEILHHQELEIILTADVVERADVRVVQPRHGARFALEPLPAVGLCRRRGWQHLDGDGASDARVQRAVDVAHASLAEEDADLVGTEPGAGFKCHGKKRRLCAHDW